MPEVDQQPKCLAQSTNQPTPRGRPPKLLQTGSHLQVYSIACDGFETFDVAWVGDLLHIAFWLDDSNTRIPTDALMTTVDSPPQPEALAASVLVFQAMDWEEWAI
ncbi:MAG: hypothetical protein FWD57_08215 [Polyangiaceae bacterium]|nr:hypothetical protein [Polyangiaceae bacterium]